MDNFQEQLSSLHAISAEIAGLHELAEIHDQALGYCMNLTGSRFAFTGLLPDASDAGIAAGRVTAGQRLMDVAAIKGFRPDPELYKMFHLMLLRNSVAGVVIKEDRSYRANDVPADPHSVGQPPATRRSTASRRAAPDRRHGHRHDRGGQQARRL